MKVPIRFPIHFRKLFTITSTLAVALLLTSCVTRPKRKTTKAHVPQDITSQNLLPAAKTVSKERLEQIQKYVPPLVTIETDTLFFCSNPAVSPTYKKIPAGSVVKVSSVEGQSLKLEDPPYTGQVPVINTDFVERVLEEAYR